MKLNIAVVALSAGLLIAGANVASGQHYGGHHGGLFGGHHDRYVPSYHGDNYGHNDWNYVVPHHPTYSGAYYTSGEYHYYTPSHITSYVPTSGGHPVAVEAQRPVELAFGGFNRYEDLAGRLMLEANALCLDLHYNCRHNRNFAEVYREAYDVLQAAKYIHSKEHQGDREAISRRMVEIDRLFHHVQQETRGWTGSEIRQVNASALPQKIAGVEAVMHHLCYDIGVKPHDASIESAPAPAAAVEEIAPPPPSIGKL